MEIAIVGEPGPLRDAIAQATLARGDCRVTRLDEVPDPSTQASPDALVALALHPGPEVASVLDALPAMAHDMARRGGGRLIIVASSAASRGLASPGDAALATSIIGISRSLTNRLAAESVTSMVVLSGVDSRGRPDGGQEVLRRTVTADDIADAVAFLCGPDAAYCHALVLPVDGGASMGRT